MHPVAGWTLIAASAAIVVVTWFALRGKVPAWAADLGTAAGGVGLAVGGLLLLDGVQPVAWFLAPVAVVVMLVLHRRLLFAGAGPLRT